MQMTDETDRLLVQVNHWRNKLRTMISLMSVAAFEGDEVKYATLKYDFETYSTLFWRFNRKLAHASCVYVV